ncbi:MAG: hypothetical protein BJ554DRAFT_326 [Olpidium bornovanus]|uniref:Uncharacterized protein n=1 Tax=Olpidium bornovanus TaxID=278681 RepID=A0A8H7ZU66_9FUNG|nr:MAG: hypothetical protein BJ554DRAFT_326 [Olpidium bornovanus]
MPHAGTPELRRLDRFGRADALHRAAQTRAHSSLSTCPITSSETGSRPLADSAWRFKDSRGATVDLVTTHWIRMLRTAGRRRTVLLSSSHTSR